MIDKLRLKDVPAMKISVSLPSVTASSIVSRGRTKATYSLRLMASRPPKYGRNDIVDCHLRGAGNRNFCAYACQAAEASMRKEAV